MNKSTLAVALSTAALVGCANKPIMEQASEGFDSARATVANAIAPTPAASAPKAASAPATASGATATKEGPGVKFDKAYDGKVSGNAAKTAARSAAANFTSLNKEYVKVTITDSTRGSKVAPVTYTGQISLESCSPTAAGTASKYVPTVVDRLGGLLGQAGANALPGGGGAVGNVVRTQTNRAATTSANDAKTSILSGATNLTAEQQKSCKDDMSKVSAEIQESVTKWVAEFTKANKGSAPVVTYTGSADLKDLQLGGVTTRSPK